MTPTRKARNGFTLVSMIVAIILLAAVATNVFFNLTAPAVLDQLPVIGIAVWVAILATAPWRAPNWSLLPGAFKRSRALP